jgi:diaphanous 1
MATWGASTTLPVPDDPSNTRLEASSQEVTSSDLPFLEDAKPLYPQNTGGLWSSWWASSGGDRGGEKKNSPQSFLDALRNAKLMDLKLVKHLIALRVHLSTAQLPWINEFVRDEKGVRVLDILMTTLVGKAGKHKKLTAHEESVLFELIKCLRVLLNTEVSCLFISSNPSLNPFSGWFRRSSRLLGHRYAYLLCAA